MKHEDLQDVGRLRPYRVGDKIFVTIHGIHGLKAEPFNGEARLTKADWIELDGIVTQAVREACPTIQSMPQLELQQDARTAEVSYEVLNENADLPKYEMRNTPLPLVYRDFNFVDRGTRPIDAAPVWSAASYVGMKLEQMLLDGIANAPGALRGTPGSGEKLLAIIDCYGPFVNVRLPSGKIAVVQATPDVIRWVWALCPTPVQWEDHFRVIAVAAPQIRQDYEGRCGIYLEE